MKALVCGITGQDGAYLAKLLLSKGYVVFGTSRDAPRADRSALSALGLPGALPLLSMAPNDFRSVLNAVQASDPDEIYFLAGQSSVGLSFDQPAETLESIVTGCLNMLEVIRITGAKSKLFNAGSSECFGDTNGVAASEGTPFRPCSPYGVAKASAHWLVANYREAYKIFACTGILFNHESALRPERFVTQKIVKAAARIADGSEERLQLGRLDIRRDWGWAPEYVEAMWKTLQQNHPVDLVIATGETRSLEEFVAESFAFHDLDWRNHVDVRADLFRPSEIAESVGDPTLAKERLGWSASMKMRSVVKQMSLAVRSSV